LSRRERRDNSKRAAFPMIEQEPHALRAQLSRSISLAQSDAAKRRSELGPGLPGVDQPQPQVRDCITTPNTKSSHRLIQDGPRVRAELLSNGERVQLRSKSVFPNESSTATNVLGYQRGTAPSHESGSSAPANRAVPPKLCSSNA
jgi:hypothetical protein